MHDLIIAYIVWSLGQQRYTGELLYFFLSRYEYRYLNGIFLKNKTLLYQHSEITVLISFMTP